MAKKYDRVFVNGKFFTSDTERPYAEAMAVKDGKIAWIGKAAELSCEGEDCVDLGGRRVIPGFVDCHQHPSMLAAFNKQISCLPPVINSLEELEAAVSEARKDLPEGAWIEGWGYDEGKLAEKRSPNRYDLDKGAADVPVSIIRTCGHVRCVNSKALELAGITRDTPDPQGGEIDRDENGEPTGVLRENARNLVTGIMPQSTLDDKISNLVDLSDVLVSQGVTTVADMGNLELDGMEYYDIYWKAREKGFRPRVAAYYMWDAFKDNKDFSVSPEQFDPESPIRLAGVKLIGDGSVSGRTAWCDVPYLGSDDEYGMPVCTPEEIRDAIEFSKKNKCQVSIHAMGARTIDRAVDIAAEAGSWLSDGIPSVRIEHVAMPTERAIALAAEKGIAFATQPIFLYAEIESYLANMTEERMKKNYPVNDILAAGVKLAFSTDAPATAWAVPSDPFPCLKGAVTRVAYDGTDCGAEHRVDIETAIRLYTAEAGDILGTKGIGRLAAGCHADFVVLDRDILEAPAEKIDEVKVAETYIDGEKVFERK